MDLTDLIMLDQILKEILKDKSYYESSGGGVTFSGGECMLQMDFLKLLLKECRKRGIHTAVDTCGFVSKEAFDKVMPYTDIFLYDLKAFDEEVHIKCTGQSNKVILEKGNAVKPNNQYIATIMKNTEEIFQQIL